MNVVLKLQKAAIAVTGVVFGVMMTATPILWSNEDTISSFLEQPNAIIETVGDTK